MFRTIAMVTVAALALAAVACVLVVGSASAQTVDPGAPLSVKVRFSDLDLTGDAGAQEMRARIRAAAATVCGGQPDLHRLDRRQDFERCRDKTVANAMDGLHAALVMAGRSQEIVLARR